MTSYPALPFMIPLLWSRSELLTRMHATFIVSFIVSYRSLCCLNASLYIRIDFVCQLRLNKQHRKEKNK